MSLKKVCVLCATYNGSKYLYAQMHSIINQENVSCDIYVSDDCSTDSTLEQIKIFSGQGIGLFVLPVDQKFGCAASNFYRLIRDVSFEAYDYVALADQDDIWVSNKIERAINELNTQLADAYSSDVVAFWPDGKQKVLVKSKPQREYDFLFEPAGPGCTYVFTVEMAGFLKNYLNQSKSSLSFDKHDWLFYAIARAAKKKWVIDPFLGLRYRQHAVNEVGANVGLHAKIVRLKIMWDGAYLGKVKELCFMLGIDEKVFFSDNPFVLRYRFLKNFLKCRRDLLEGVFLVLMIFFGVARIPK